MEMELGELRMGCMDCVWGKKGVMSAIGEYVAR